MHYATAAATRKIERWPIARHALDKTTAIGVEYYQIIIHHLRTFVAIFYHFMGLQIFGLLRLDLTLYEYNIMDIEDTIMIVCEILV